MGRSSESNGRASRRCAVERSSGHCALQDAPGGSEIAEVRRILQRASKDARRQNRQENYPQAVLGGGGPVCALSLNEGLKCQEDLQSRSRRPSSLRFYEFPSRVESQRPRREWCAGSKRKAAN